MVEVNGGNSQGIKSVSVPVSDQQNVMTLGLQPFFLHQNDFLNFLNFHLSETECCIDVAAWSMFRRKLS